MTRTQCVAIVKDADNGGWRRCSLSSRIGNRYCTHHEWCNQIPVVITWTADEEKR